MLKRLNFGAQALSHIDIKAYNSSPVSTLTCFPKMSYEDAMALSIRQGSSRESLLF